MARALSVDLAFRSYSNCGFCLLTPSRTKRLQIEYPSPADIGLKDPPSPKPLAEALLRYCRQVGAQVLLIDGPQGWEDPDTKVRGCRVCEKELNTPWRTGEPGRTQPPHFLPYARFTIALVDHLAACGAELPGIEPFCLPAEGPLVLETFPTAAWLSLELEPLRPKSKCKPDDVMQGCDLLQRLSGLYVPGTPTHDEVQALVAGLAGVAVLNSNRAGYQPVGAPFRSVAGTRREGYIVNPTVECLKLVPEGARIGKDQAPTKTPLPRWGRLPYRGS